MHSLCHPYGEVSFTEITSLNVNLSYAYTALVCDSLQKSIYVDNTLFCKASHIILNKPRPGLKFPLICFYWKIIFCLSFNEEEIRCFRQKQLLELLEQGCSTICSARGSENLNRRHFFYIYIQDNQILLVDHRTSLKILEFLNPFMHNIEKSQTYFKNLAV